MRLRFARLFCVLLLQATERELFSGEVSFPEVIEFPGQTLIFKPTRDDLTVGHAYFAMWRSNMTEAMPLTAIRINGIKPEFGYLDLKQVGTNQFELPAMKIEFSSNEFRGPLYITIKAMFREIGNNDAGFYENPLDRYALLSYCTNEDDESSKVNARNGANRVKTLKEFKERLGKPFIIKLNQRPLR